MLVLYTFDDSFAAPAHSKLGWFYYRTGRFARSVSQPSLFRIYRVSQVREIRKERDVEYEFSTIVGPAFDNGRRMPSLRSYAQSDRVIKDIYYLAGSMFANGYPKHASDIWSLLKAAASAGQYRELAAMQLRKPFVEPLLTINR